MKKQVSMLLISLMVGVASASAQEMKKVEKVEKRDQFQKQRIEIVAQRLELSDAQKVKFQEALAKNQKEMLEARQRCEARIEKVLTAEQFTKYQEMMKAQKQQGRGHGKHMKGRHGHQMQSADVQQKQHK